MLAPVMHPLHINVYHFYCPNYLLWTNWDSFITGGDDGLDASDHPTRAVSTVDEGYLENWLGLSTFDSSTPVNALPFRMYQLIYNTYFADRDIETITEHSMADGVDATSYGLKTATWQKDYFTTCRPWETLGNDVTVPVGGDGSSIGVQGGTSSATTVLSTTAGGDVELATPTGQAENLEFRGAGNAGMVFDVDDLRLAIAKDRLQRRAAEHGGRYYEYLRSMGIRGDDMRLGRPVLLAGGRNVVQVSEVVAQGTESGSTELGDLAGHGVSAMGTKPFVRFFREHGFIMSLAVVRPIPIYTSATERMWYRTTKEDYYQPEYAHIGDQIVTNKEIDSSHATPDGTFGYQERYSEYRRTLNLVTGEFKSTDDHWHFARQWASDPALNTSFLRTSSIAERPFADSVPHHFRLLVQNNFVARRMMDKTGKVRQSGI